MTNGGDRQVKAWRGAFGDSYIARNQATEERIRQRVFAFAEILRHLAAASPASILEVGANVGLNLRALRRLTGAELFAVEPSGTARAALLADRVVPTENLRDATAAKLPFGDHSFDLVFTSTVLIHIPDEALEQSCREIFRVSRRYILSMEYFSPRPERVPYRGHDDLLFKRDYGSLWLDLFPGLTPLADGFFWRRTTGLDDVTWWLFRKP